MDLFDLHCDTISRLRDGSSFADAGAHISLEKSVGIGRWAQVYAMFVEDNAPGKDTAYDTYRQLYACFQKQMAVNTDRVAQCRTAADLKRAFSDGKCAAIVSVENGAVLGGRIERLSELARDGVRLLTLTWMGENELGCGGEAGGPLTAFGRRVLSELPRYGIIPDISHLSDEGVANVFSEYDGPVVATHSNVRRVTGHHRNLTEKQIHEIVKRRGLIGINLCRSFLSKECAKANREDVYAHISAFLECGAEDVLAFGTDFDGAPIPNDIRDLTGMCGLYHYLAGRGLTEDILRKIFFENAMRFWERNFS